MDARAPSRARHTGLYELTRWAAQWRRHRTARREVRRGGADPLPPEPILQAQRGHDDPDQKIIAMLDARRLCETESRGKGVAKPKALTDENLTILVR